MELANVILAPYFTKKLRFHQHDSSHNGKGGSKPNDFSLISGWYTSTLNTVRKFSDTKAIIFHNECSQEFIDKYSNNHLEFVLWTKKHRPSYNDERFYAYYEYIKTHPEIQRVFMTDMFDVKIFANPFRLMDNKPGFKYFIGEEMMSKSSSKWMVRKCREMSVPLFHTKYAPGTLAYNAGIVGGYREPIIILLQTMITEFKKIHPRYNANMPVFNRAIDIIGDKIFSGFPLHNKFRSNKYQEGIFIKHK